MAQAVQREKKSIERQNAKEEVQTGICLCMSVSDEELWQSDQSECEYHEGLSPRTKTTRYKFHCLSVYV
jgi:hypothetical protein